MLPFWRSYRYQRGVGRSPLSPEQISRRDLPAPAAWRQHDGQQTRRRHNTLPKLIYTPAIGEPSPLPRPPLTLPLMSFLLARLALILTQEDHTGGSFPVHVRTVVNGDENGTQSIRSENFLSPQRRSLSHSRAPTP